MCLLNPGISAAIVVDTEAKARELLGRCRDFARQLGLELALDNAKKIVLVNGSSIQALTATSGTHVGESKVARSQSFQVLHLTELCYWPNQGAFSALLATSSGSPVWCETTAKSTGDLFWRLWHQPNDYRKIFFSVEQHAQYRLPADQIDDAKWEEAKSQGFTSRECAAWWYRELDAKGGLKDIISMCHDYPVVPAHSFLTWKGRWCRTNPAILPHTSQNQIKVYELPQPRHSYLAGVDTSGGVGRDGNCVVVLDRTTKKMVGFWKDSQATTAQVAAKLQQIDQIWHPDVFAIETNGIGQATLQEAKALGLPCRSVTTTESTKYQGLLLARNHIDSGLICGPEELAEEASDLYCDEDGKFKGKKDAFMALGFALREIERSPLGIVERPDPNLFRPEDWLKPQTGQMWK